MTVTRRINDISITFDGMGAPTVIVTGLVIDDVEDTSAGVNRRMIAPAVLTAAAALRDAVLTVAANAGKPLTF